MSDQLRDRFDALRSAADHSDAGGLRDVHARRTRRTRARVAAASAATVAALALGGVLVLPGLTEKNASDTTTAAGGQAVDDADRGADAQPLEEPVIEQAPGASDAPPQEDAAAGPFAVTSASLLTWPDIQAAGETGPGTTPYGATLVFPGLCGAANAWEQYSGPDEVVAAAWVISDGVLTQSDLQYESDLQAADALARLSVDTQACPIVNEYASIVYVGTDASVGAEIAFFDMRVESGQDGSISVFEISVTRVANVLVEVVFRPDGPAVADAEQRSRAVATAAVDRVVATG